MSTAIESALRHVEQVAQELPTSMQDSMAESILERVEQFKESVGLMSLADTAFGEDWDNELDAAYDKYDENYAIQAR